MKAWGIIAEYNPFHNGHAYQIEKIKETNDAEVIIAIMSGNFLQRGEPAILDKWTRTEMALSAGVDLVIELPVLWSTQPADYFAEGAVRLLEALKIDTISFGVEAGESVDFLEAAKFLLQNEKQIMEAIENHPEMNMAYAQKMEEAILSLNPCFPLDLSSPNVQLALSYQKAILDLKLEEKINIFPIERIGAGYQEEKINYHPSIASATAIRKAVFREEDVDSYLVESTQSLFNQEDEKKVSWENYFPYLKYQLIIKTKSELREIYQMTEGLENRLKKYIPEADSFEEFMNKIKTKRYTRTRLQRLLIYVLLNIKKSDIKELFYTQSVIRILGFNQKGQNYLNSKKDEFEYPLVSNINQETKKLLDFEIKSGEIYRLGHSKIRKQDFSRKPVIFD